MTRIQSPDLFPVDYTLMIADDGWFNDTDTQLYDTSPTLDLDSLDDDNDHMYLRTNIQGGDGEMRCHFTPPTNMYWIYSSELKFRHWYTGLAIPSAKLRKIINGVVTNLRSASPPVIATTYSYTDICRYPQYYNNELVLAGMYGEQSGLLGGSQIKLGCIQLNLDYITTDDVGVVPVAEDISDNSGTVTVAWYELNVPTNVNISKVYLQRENDNNPDVWATIGSKTYQNNDDYLSYTGQPAGVNKYRLYSESYYGGISITCPEKTCRTCYTPSGGAWSTSNTDLGQLKAVWNDLGSNRPEKMQVTIVYPGSTDNWVDATNDLYHIFTGLNNNTDYKFKYRGYENGYTSVAVLHNTAKQVTVGWQGTICGTKNPENIGGIEIEIIDVINDIEDVDTL